MTTKPKLRRVSKRSLTELKGCLLRRRTVLMAELQHRFRDNQLGSDAPLADLGDMASSECDAQFVIMFTEAESRELAEVEEALDRIESGDYGRCECCAKLIGVARLKAVPFARLCLDCKRNEERVAPRSELGSKGGPRTLLYGPICPQDDDEGDVDMQEIEAESVETEPADDMADAL